LVIYRLLLEATAGILLMSKLEFVVARQTRKTSKNNVSVADPHGMKEHGRLEPF
jgi:hypothetical protein